MLILVKEDTKLFWKRLIHLGVGYRPGNCRRGTLKPDIKVDGVMTKGTRNWQGMGCEWTEVQERNMLNDGTLQERSGDPRCDMGPRRVSGVTGTSDSTKKGSMYLFSECVYSQIHLCPGLKCICKGVSDLYKSLE